MALFPKRSPFSSSLPSFFFSTTTTTTTTTKASLSDILSRDWMLQDPSTPIHKISLTTNSTYSNNTNPTLTLTPETNHRQTPSFYIVRDDLLHPFLNGNKSRKLDALLPLLQQYSTTDVVTCGGCQSAHTAALAAACAERGMRAHLLLRGEQPEVPTGYNLVSLMFGDVTYVSRPAYVRREEMLSEHAEAVAGEGGIVIRVDDILGLNPEVAEVDGSSRRVVIVSEGAGDVVGLLGVIRLVRYLSQAHVFGTDQQINIVVDAGTGTTAIGLALGALCLGLPWKVTAVMLADTIESYKEKEKCLIANFGRIHQLEILEQTADSMDGGIVHWVERMHSRRFGKVLKGEMGLCRKISMQTGILLDPIYTLAAWEKATLLSLLGSNKEAKVVMLHTGGMLGLFGLAQRYSSDFNTGGNATDCY